MSYIIYLNDKEIPGAIYPTKTKAEIALCDVKDWCAYYSIGMSRWDYDGLIMMFSIVIPDDIYTIKKDKTP